jgi:hypothetical protein
MPDTFKVDVHFNAQMTPPRPVEGKQKMSNALIPCTIAYVGEPVCFAVPMGTEVRSYRLY